MPRQMECAEAAAAAEEEKMMVCIFACSVPRLLKQFNACRVMLVGSHFSTKPSNKLKSPQITEQSKHLLCSECRHPKSLIAKTTMLSNNVSGCTCPKRQACQQSKSD